MGQFNNLLVKGSSRFLGKIFCSDISISGDTVLTGSITATGRSSFTGGINVGYENTSYKLSTASLIVNDWIITNGATGWYSQTYGGGWHMTDTTYIRAYNTKRVLAANGIYTSNNAAYYLDTNGKLNASSVVSGSGTINSLTVQTALNASSANGSFNNLSVNNTIKAVKYEISHVMNLGGNFICSPSFYFTEGTTTVTVNAKTGNVVQLLITDSTSIQSTDMAGATWYAGSKIRLSGIINSASLSSVDGTVTRTMNTVNAGTLLVDLDVGSLSSSFTVNNTYSGTNVSNLCVMMYEINMNISGTTKNRPIGIKMTSYGTNKASYVDVWSGASDTPNVRFGLLNNTGLPNVNDATPTGWGLYTTNGYFQGTVVSNAGKIGNFNISSALYSGTHSSYASSNTGVYIGADGISIGANFKVDNQGNLISSTLNSKISSTITATVEEFYQSTSATSLAEGSWSTTTPTWTTGKYIWRRTKVTYGDNTTGYTPSANGVCITGNTGSTGVSIISVDVQYYLSTSSTQQTGGSWQTAVPAWENGKYIWTKTITKLSDNSTKTSNPVCITGAKGTNGVSVSSIRELYHTSSSKTTAPTKPTSPSALNGWVVTCPTWTSGTYIWTLSEITYNPISYSYTSPVCDSSWEAVNEVEIGGINRFIKKNVTTGIFLNSTGAEIGNTDWGYTDYINVMVWKYYVSSGYTNLGNNPSTCFYNSDKTFISATTGSAGRSCLPIPSGAAYMRFSFVVVDLDTIKIEKGTKPTDYSPAPEDIEKNILDASSEIASIKNSYSTIEQTKSNITLAVGELKETLNSNMEETVKSSVQQASDEISITITNTVEEKANGLVTKDEISKWMTFTEEGKLILGNSESAFTVQISNEELGFYEDENRVAYINDSKLYIDQAILISRMDLGDFTIEYDESTGFSIS